MNNKKSFAIIQNILDMAPLLFILIMFILHLILLNKTFSKDEGRYLAQLPTFHIEEALNGSYGTKVESYYLDQFPFRNFWIYIQESSNQILLKR
jgi:hypothetical protein